MFGFDTILIAEKGRETLYTEHYPFLYEQIKVLDKFQDMLNEDFQNWLIEERGIFIPNRSFSSYIPIDDIEVGFAGRIQSNKGGFLELPAREQLKINVPNTNQEVGHEGRTMRESLKIHALEAVKKFIKICQQIYPPGMIGMCGLQGILVEIDGKIYYVLFDVSPRVPGDPIIGPTSPEMRILNIKLAKLGFNAKIEDPLDMTMLEIEEAHKRGRLPEIVT